MRTFHFVRRTEIEAFASRGWRILNDLSTNHHGQHAVLMEQVMDVDEEREGECLEPAAEDEG